MDLGSAMEKAEVGSQNHDWKEGTTDCRNLDARKFEKKSKLH